MSFCLLVGSRVKLSDWSHPLSNGDISTVEMGLADTDVLGGGDELVASITTPTTRTKARPTIAAISLGFLLVLAGESEGADSLTTSLRRMMIVSGAG